MSVAQAEGVREAREANKVLRGFSLRSYLAARAMESFLDLVDDPSPRRFKRFLREFQTAAKP